MNKTLCNNGHYDAGRNYSQTSFVIKHYAGEVEYEISSFIEKDKD